MQGHLNVREVMLNVWKPWENKILKTEALRYAANLRPGTSAFLKDMAEFVKPSIPGRTVQACGKRLQDLNIWVSTGKRKRRRNRNRTASNGRQRAMAAMPTVNPLDLFKDPAGEAVIGYIKVIKCPCGRTHKVE